MNVQIKISCCYFLFFGVLCFHFTFAQPPILTGAERMEDYLSKISDKKVGIVVNQTSIVGGTHLVDTLLRSGVNITGIYAPEHGYRGTTERGKTITDDKDEATGIAIYSIYGSKKKPSPEVLEEVEVMIFDMQDVGARFFTYISTLHYIMEACAENDIELLVLDRPNPIGYYVDGPVLDPKFKSFIGMHPVPIAHGMTIGEYAQMINGEGWLNEGIQCKLTVIPLENYHHSDHYQVPVAPSPNLPDMKSIYLYPSICLFEGTVVSEGRGTYKPFQQFGTPSYKPQKSSFVPEPIPSMSSDPKFEGQTCYGYDLSHTPIAELQAIRQINLDYLLEFYQKSEDKKNFFQSSFNLLGGSDQLQQQIVTGKTKEEIRASWQPGLEQFMIMRKKYLLYPD